MLQSGGVYPGIRPLEVLELFASYYDDPRSGLRDLRRHHNVVELLER